MLFACACQSSEIPLIYYANWVYASLRISRWLINICSVLFPFLLFFLHFSTFLYLSIGRSHLYCALPVFRFPLRFYLYLVHSNSFTFRVRCGQYKVGGMLINRVADTDERWHQEVTTAAPRVSPIIDLTLDDIAVKRAIDNLNFIQVRCMFCLSYIYSLFLSSLA